MEIHSENDLKYIRCGGGGVQDRHEVRTLVKTKIKIILKAIKYEEFLHHVGKRYPVERNFARRSHSGFVAVTNEPLQLGT